MTVMSLPGWAKIALALLAASGAAGPSTAQKLAVGQASAPAVSADGWSYSDVADLIVGTPIVFVGGIVDAIALPPTPGALPPAGAIRYYLVAEVQSLIRGPATGLPPRIAFIADVPRDARGRPPRLRRLKIVVAATAVPDRPAEVRLVARDALQPWSAAFEARVRTIAAAAIAPDAPPQVTGVQSAFHVVGTLPGEGETQVFLTTASARPVSLTVLRRPGIAPTWAVALGEIVDEAAGPPRRDTLLWYRLACGLPPALPTAALGELAPSDAEAARVDYGFVLAQLGRCGRTRG